MLNTIMMAIATADKGFDNESRHGRKIMRINAAITMTELKRDRLTFHLSRGAELVPEIMPVTAQKPQIAEQKIRIGVV